MTRWRRPSKAAYARALTFGEELLWCLALIRHLHQAEDPRAWELAERLRGRLDREAARHDPWLFRETVRAASRVAELHVHEVHSGRLQ